MVKGLEVRFRTVGSKSKGLQKMFGFLSRNQVNVHRLRV